MQTCLGVPQYTGPQPHHRQSELDVALLDTVDAGILQEARCAVDPPAATGEIALEAEPLDQLDPEMRRPVHGALTDADLVGADPIGEGFLVMARQIGRRGASVEVVDVERVDLDTGEQPPRVSPPLAVACRPSVFDGSHHVTSLVQVGRRSGEERFGNLGEHAQEHPHLGDSVAVEPVHEGVA